SPAGRPVSAIRCPAWKPPCRHVESVGAPRAYLWPPPPVEKPPNEPPPVRPKKPPPPPLRTHCAYSCDEAPKVARRSSQSSRPQRDSVKSSAITISSITNHTSRRLDP